MADVGITKVVEQAHGLRTERSGGPATVGHDPRSPIRQRFGRASRQLDDGQIDRARNVPRGERLRREDIDQRNALVAQPANDIVTRHLGKHGPSSHGGGIGLTDAVNGGCDRLEQLGTVDRLRDVAIHAGCQEALPVALHRIGGHRDDR